MLKFTVPLPPSVNNYLGKRVAYAGGRPFVQVYETVQAKKYKSFVKKLITREMEEQGWETTKEDTYVICRLVVFMNKKRRDVDNLFKCLLDSFTEAEIFYDDSLAIPRVENIYIDSNNPRIEVEIEMAAKTGVFQNEDHLIEFTNNCKNCKRFKRNCSILKGLKENKINEKFNLNKFKCEV